MERQSEAERSPAAWARIERMKAAGIGLFRRNRRAILLCLAATFAWGLLAHGVCFLGGVFSHDSLNELNASVFGDEWRIQLGRVLVPAYRAVVRGAVTLPWLIGVLSLLYIAAAVFLTVKIFDIRSAALTVMISGIFTVNIAVIATAASFIHDLDCDMLALALSVLSVYCLKRARLGFVWGMIPLCAALGLYQGYMSVAVTLIVLATVMRLLDGETLARAMAGGLKGIAMLIGGGLLYLVLIAVVCRVTGVALSSGEYNSIDTVLSLSVRDVIGLVGAGYLKSLDKILHAVSPYPDALALLVHAAIIVLPLLLIVLALHRRAVGIGEGAAALILTAILPIAMNVVFPLTGGMTHSLMEFGLWLVYLFALLIAWWTAERGKGLGLALRYGQRLVLSCLVLAVLWGNVRTANAAYLKKSLERQANLSLFTRIVAQMEGFDGYVTGTTPVVFVGEPDAVLGDVTGLESLKTITGCGQSFALTYGWRSIYAAYFDYMLLNTARIADEATWSSVRQDDRVARMPCYPEAGSIAMVDGVMVVKLGDGA